MNLIQLFSILHCPEKTLQFLRERGIIENQHYCSICNQIMSQQLRAKLIKNKFSWRCKKCKYWSSIFSNSFFFGIHEDIRTNILAIYEICFSADYKSFQLKLGVGQTFCQNLYTRIANLFSTFLLSRYTEKIGSAGSIIEIDETYYGRRFSVVGVVDLTTGLKRFRLIDAVNNETIDAFIRDTVNPCGCILVFDGARIYDNILERLPEYFIDDQSVIYSSYEF